MDTLAYLEFFNKAIEEMEGNDSISLDFETKAIVRRSIQRCYTRGFRDGNKGVSELSLQADSNLKVQRLMNRYKR